ncbi:MAG: YIP1 family protein [archaeon]|nr:YIP1 family protein [archaeon]MCP8320015.1 YIP1 family protein [archaeon]
MRRRPSSGLVGFLDRLGGTLLEPGKTFYDILEEKRGILEPLFLIIIFFSIQGALIGVFIVRILYSFLAFLSPIIGAGQLKAFQESLFIIPIVTTVSWIIFALLLWVISAGIAHLCARYVFKGIGSYIQLLKLYGYASVPSSLVTLAMLFVSLDFFLFFGFSIILCLIAVFWTVIILVVAVERCHLIDPGQAFISSFIAPLIFYLILSALIWLIFSALGGFFL